MSRDILRWAFGSPDGARSSVWRLWTGQQGDIYFALRSLGGVIKASFHRDGNCQLGFTSQYAPTAASRFGKTRRHWERWQLPSEPVFRIARILVPGTELRPSPISEKDRKIIWLPSPPNGCVGIITILLATVSMDHDEAAPGLVGIVRSNLPHEHCTGLNPISRVAMVFSSTSSIDDHLASVIATERAKLQSVGEPNAGTRATLFDFVGDQHEISVLELAHDLSNLGNLDQ